MQYFDVFLLFFASRLLLPFDESAKVKAPMIARVCLCECVCVYDLCRHSSV